MNITIDRTKVSSGQNNFAVLIDFTNPTFVGKTQANGQDFVFTDVNNLKLNHQIESYSSTTGHLITWVRIPVLSSTADTIIRMYYGNPTCGDQQSTTGVWDKNYLTVLHLNEKQTTFYDSTVNKNNGTLSGNVTQTQGKIGGSISLTGGYVALPRICTNQTQFTFSAWIYPRSGARYFISEWNNYQGAFLQVSGDTEIQFYINGQFVSKSVSLNQWQYVVGTFDGTTARLWVNGGTSSSMSTSTPTWPSQGMFIGDRADHTRKFNGYIDEVRVSKMARSGDWIKTEYNNQNSPSTFCKAGAEETFSA